MGTTIKLPDDLVKEAKAFASVYHRSVPKQLEHWMRMGKIAEENPDLSYQFVQDTLLSLENVAAGEVEPFEFEELAD